MEPGLWSRQISNESQQSKSKVDLDLRSQILAQFLLEWKALLDTSLSDNNWYNRDAWFDNTYLMHSENDQWR